MNYRDVTSAIASHNLYHYIYTNWFNDNAPQPQPLSSAYVLYQRVEPYLVTYSAQDVDTILDDFRDFVDEWNRMISSSIPITSDTLRTLTSGLFSKDRLYYDLIPTKNRTCLCCGYRTLDPCSPFDICPICAWQDEPVLRDDPEFVGGVNGSFTLRQAQKNFRLLGACAPESVNRSRQPTESDERDPDWRPLPE